MARVVPHLVHSVDDAHTRYFVQFLFKKYLDYEKAHGDEERIEHVKRKAMEYVDTKLG
jgi:hypothetical protein